MGGDGEEGGGGVRGPGKLEVGVVSYLRECAGSVRPRMKVFMGIDNAESPVSFIGIAVGAKYFGVISKAKGATREWNEDRVDRRRTAAQSPSPDSP